MCLSTNFFGLSIKIVGMVEKDVVVFWDWVDKRLDEVGITSFRDLERKSGFTYGAIGKRKNELKFPTTEMAEGLCRALRVDWVELWFQAGFVDRLSSEQVSLTVEGLSGIDAEIYFLLRGTGDDFKQAVLKTIKTWLILYEELKR
jgi:hypothetical protein